MYMHTLYMEYLLGCLMSTYTYIHVHGILIRVPDVYIHLHGILIRVLDVYIYIYTCTWNTY